MRLLLFAAIVSGIAHAAKIECSCPITGTCQFAGTITSSDGNTKEECVERLKRVLTGTKTVYGLGEDPDDPDHFCECQPITFKKTAKKN